MATAEQIRDKAIKRLQIVSRTQTPSAGVTADLDAAYAEVYAQLEALTLTNWDLDDDVPDEFVHWVVALTAYGRVDEYSVPNDRYQRIVSDAGIAESKIRTLQASNVYEQPTAEFF